MSAPSRNCPRCRGTMVQRLDEYECERCGHFMPLEPDAAAAAPARRGGIPGIHTAPQPPPSGRLMGNSRGMREHHLALAQRAYLIVLAISQLLGGLVLMGIPKSQLGFTLTIAHVIVATILTMAVAATLVYIDWFDLKKIALVIIAVSILGFGFIIYRNIKIFQPVISVKLLVDTGMQVWLMVLLFRDINLNE
jgi:hypothetical protein